MLGLKYKAPDLLITIFPTTWAREAIQVVWRKEKRKWSETTERDKEKNNPLVFWDPATLLTLQSETSQYFYIVSPFIKLVQIRTASKLPASKKSHNHCTFSFAPNFLGKLVYTPCFTLYSTRPSVLFSLFHLIFCNIWHYLLALLWYFYISL